MSDDAEVTMLMYAGLKPGEESKLKSVDSDVAKTLIDNGINDRVMWTSHSDMEARSIRLCTFGKSQPQILFELPAEKVAYFTAREILSRLLEKWG